MIEMRIVCDNPHHDRGHGVCSFCVQKRIDVAVEKAKMEQIPCPPLADLIELTKERDAALLQLAEAEKLKQGYYDEAAKGWQKFRDAELQVDDLKSALRQCLERTKAVRTDSEIDQLGAYIESVLVDKRSCVRIGCGKTQDQHSDPASRSCGDFREKRIDEPEPRHCVKCGARVEKGDAAHPYSCIGKGSAANPAPFHECVGVRYCAICNVRV